MKHQRSFISIAMATIMLVSLCAVCASTNVSAADSDSNRAIVGASPPGQPIAAGTGPSVCLLYQGSYPSSETDVLYVFVKGYDGTLWYRVMSLKTEWWTGGWTSLGGQLSSSPSAVARSAGLLDVYIRGTDGAVWEIGYDGAWHDWHKIGGQVAPGTGPGASGWPGREDIFIEGTNGALYQKTWTSSSGWSGWTNLGGKLTSSPAATSWDAGRIDVCVRGTNGAVYHKHYQNGWSGWGSLGGYLARGTGPAMSSWNIWSAPRLDIFVTSTAGAMYQKTWTSSSGWSGWANLGGYLTATPTATSWYGYIITYVRNADGNVCQREYELQRWEEWACGMHGPPCRDNCG